MTLCARTTIAALVLVLAASGCVSGSGRTDDAPAHPLLVEAEEHFLAGDADGALARYRAYRQGFGPSPHCADAWYFEGVILLEKGDLPGAERAFKACAGAPRTTFLAAMAEAGLGDTYFVADRYEAAIEAYDRALEKHCREARNDYILYRMAVANQRLGHWSRGQTCYDLLLRDHPRSPFAARARQRMEHAHQAYFLQVGAFQDEENAKTLTHYALSKGLRAQVVRSYQADAPYVVWVGGYTRLEDAKEAVPEVAQVCGRDVQLVP